MYIKIGIVLILLLSCSFFFIGEEEIPTFQDYWYNQGAEITRYELKQSRYGEERTGELVCVYVTEPFHRIDHVKSDDPNAANAIPILKLNALRSFNTGIYNYSVMRSIFQPTQMELYPHALKATCSVQEWCGHVFEQINRADANWKYQLHSYFQSEGEQRSSIEESYLEDAYWTMIRLNPKLIPLGKQKIIPSAVWRRFSHTPVSAEEAVVILNTADDISTLNIQYKNISRSLEINFTTRFPHSIDSWKESFNGKETTGQMTHRSFGPYWEWNSNEHAPKRSELGLH